MDRNFFPSTCRFSWDSDGKLERSKTGLARQLAHGDYRFGRTRPVLVFICLQRGAQDALIDVESAFAFTFLEKLRCIARYVRTRHNSPPYNEIQICRRMRTASLDRVGAQDINALLEAADEIGSLDCREPSAFPRSKAAIVSQAPPAKTKIDRPIGWLICPSWNLPSCMVEIKCATSRTASRLRTCRIRPRKRAESCREAYVAHVMKRGLQILLRIELGEIELEHLDLAQEERIGNFDELRICPSAVCRTGSKADPAEQLRDCPSDLRKFAEQWAGAIGWNESNRAYILTYGVRSVEWSNYQHPLPEHVYDVYTTLA